MKVLHITNNYPTKNFPIYGIFVKEQINSLSALGVLSEVFFINGREKGKKEYFNSFLRLFKLLYKEKYDIIHCHHVYSAMIYLLTGNFILRKCIVSYQNPPENEGGKFLFHIISFLFNSIIIKNSFRNDRGSKIKYLPNGVNIDLFNPSDKLLSKNKLNLSLGKKYILFMDSNNKKRTQKRLDRFNEVINILKNKKGIEIEPLILTNTRRENIPDYMSAVDLYLLTSDFEGSPNAVKESMACNLPVVSTPVGNVKELLNGVKGSYISNSFSSEELAELAYMALINMGNNGREMIVKKGLDINSVANKLLKIYKEIL